MKFGLICTADTTFTLISIAPYCRHKSVKFEISQGFEIAGAPATILIQHFVVAVK